MIPVEGGGVPREQCLVRVRIAHTWKAQTWTEQSGSRVQTLNHSDICPPGRGHTSYVIYWAFTSSRVSPGFWFVQTLLIKTRGLQTMTVVQWGHHHSLGITHSCFPGVLVELNGCDRGWMACRAEIFIFWFFTEESWPSPVLDFTCNNPLSWIPWNFKDVEPLS